MIHVKNIFANILVLLFGYVGMLLLRSFDQYFSIPNFQLGIYPAISFIVIGLCIRIWASIAFSKNHVGILNMNPRSKLITSGPYKYSRNPLYVGILFVTFGFVLLAGSITGLFLTVSFFIFWNFLIAHKEEVDLKKQFGKEFDNYKLRVNRWI